MFVDESGQDQSESPYEVLAGLVVQDAQLWPLVKTLSEAELDHFGCRYSDGSRELKARQLLKTKVFRQARSRPDFESNDRRRLAEFCLRDGAGSTPEHQAALAQAKLAYTKDALRVARQFDCRVFASITPQTAPRPESDFLRKDYTYLFERFFFLLSQSPQDVRGLVVFDELERSQSHLLIDQMAHYFVETATGRTRSRRVIPEPFFVHSHLTTGVHLADLVAYVIAWGLRSAILTAEGREEPSPYADLVRDLGFDQRVGRRTVWAFNLLNDLRSRSERGEVVRGLTSRPVRVRESGQ